MYPGEFIFQSEDGKLGELLNVKTEAICNYIRFIYFITDKIQIQIQIILLHYNVLHSKTDKEVNLWFGADTNVI